MKYMVFLIIITNLYTRSQMYFSRICRNYLIQNLQDRGLSCTIASDERHSLTALDFKIKIREQRLGRKCLGQSQYRKYVITAYHPRLQFDMHICLYFRRLVQHIQLVQHFLTALGTLDGFLPVEGFQLGNNFLLMFDLPLLVQIRLHLCFPKHGFFLGIVGIIAHEGGHLSLINLDNFGHNSVEKIPVM